MNPLIQFDGRPCFKASSVQLLPTACVFDRDSGSGQVVGIERSGSDVKKDRNLGRKQED